MKFWTIVLITILFWSMSFADQRNDSKEFVDQILNDVFDKTINERKRILKENTGIDLRTRGYKITDKYSGEISDKKYRELDKLSDEHDRNIKQLYKELDIKITKSRDEFERESAKEYKIKKSKKSETSIRKRLMRHMRNLTKR